jgi:C-terminal processing protease CtpA/Prc
MIISKLNLIAVAQAQVTILVFIEKISLCYFSLQASMAIITNQADDADKINYTGELKIVKYIYGLIESVNSKGKLSFTKTRESTTSSKNSFKVSLGVMPDYTFSGGGVRIDGVSEGKLAQRIGLKAGDILLELGAHKFSDVQSYMQVLGKFNKGEATKLKIKRGAEELVFDIVF